MSYKNNLFTYYSFIYMLCRLCFILLTSILDNLYYYIFLGSNVYPTRYGGDFRLLPIVYSNAGIC